MTMSHPDLIETKTAFARRCGVSPGRVSQWLSEGRLKPEHIVGSGRTARIKVELALAHLRGVLDPGMSKIPAVARAAVAEASKPTPRIEGQQLPDPAEYRDRPDLPDDFARGMLYGAHAVAHLVPCLVGCELKEAGCSDDAAVAAYREQAGEYADCLVSDALLALGLITEEQEEPGSRHPYVPTRFAGFDPSGRWN